MEQTTNEMLLRCATIYPDELCYCRCLYADNRSSDAFELHMLSLRLVDRCGSILNIIVTNGLSLEGVGTMRALRAYQ
jgi:hypothetical protein